MKENSLIINEKGFALVTTMLLSFLTMGLIAVAYFMTSSSSQLFGVEKRYSVELDTAKGVADYIMAEIRNENLTCNAVASGPCIADSTPNVCSANAQIILNPLICTALGKTAACTGLSACYMSEDPLNDPPLNTTYYSVRVTSLNVIGENVTIDFVYKTEEE